MKCKILVCVVVIQLIISSLVAQTQADGIVGIWLTGGKEPANIQIYKSGDKYFGKIIWLKAPEENGKPKLDKENPDKSKRNQQIIGLVILKDFKFNRRNEWEDGKIYDPENGKTYSCNLTLKDRNILDVRGYIGLSLFGRTETWTRTK